MSEFHVSGSGNDNNPGTITQPFLTIAKGIGLLQEGDTLYLHHGVYLGTVNIANKHGTSAAPIVIRSYPGEHACIDGSLSQFRTLSTDNWRPASLDDPKAHPDEYISTKTFTSDPVNRGAFLDTLPYTRLITYSNINDLRSENETFDLITDYPLPDPREGPEVMERCSDNNPEPECVLFQDGKKYKPGLVKVKCESDDPDSNCEGKPGEKFKFVRYRRPWVYMGPGLWFDRAAHKVHIRLSRTHNNIPGLVDYTGETDPNKVRLAISSKAQKTLSISASKHLRLEDLSIRFGGDETISLLRSEGLVFDHVRIRASRFGVRMGGEATRPATNTVFRHCEFDGGMPTWYFRTDRKSGYFYVEDGKIIENNLGGSTLDVLLLGNPNDTGTHIHHCEFHDAHDVYLHGANLSFHHNWIHNLNDEGLFLDDGTPQQPQFYRMNIFQNVITKTLSAISFAGNHPTGQWSIYRNLIDLRSPTAGFRPRHAGDTRVWRFGHLIKSILPDGPRDLFHNTFLVYGQQEQASYLHYRDTTGEHLRRTFNNIFVAINPDFAADKAITFLPLPSFPGPTDGNNYHRMGLATRKPYRYLGYTFNGQLYPSGTFADLNSLRNSEYFEQSKNQYPPGYEADSIETDPGFNRLDASGIPYQTDDLRLSTASQAIAAGVTLPDDLGELDPFRTDSGRPDIGCYPLGACPLQVGVDSRKSYPFEA